MKYLFDRPSNVKDMEMIKDMKVESLQELYFDCGIAFEIHDGIVENVVSYLVE